MAPLTEQTSYGLVAGHLVDQLVRAGEKIAFSSIGQAEPNSKEQVIALATQPDPSHTSIRLYHQFALSERIGDGLHCGFPIFELDNFSENEKQHLRSVDKLIVCSEWAKNVVKNSVGIDSVVVPLGVDTDLFSSAKLNQSQSTTIFLNVGKWEYRKGHDFLAEAFRAAFSPSDDVKLIMHSYNIFLGENNKIWENHYRKILGDQVEFVKRGSYADVISSYAAADCLVAPTRAEGWGMPILEAMAMGLPVITTDVSGQTEFVNEENSMLLCPAETEVASDGVWFSPDRTGNGSWAKIDDDTFELLVTYLRIIHIKKLVGENLFNETGVATAQKFTWAKSAERLLEAMI